MLPNNFGSHRVDDRNHHGHGHSILLLFDPCRVAWKHHNVVYLDYVELQSHNSGSKRVVDTRTHKVNNSVHTVVHNIFHEKLHEMSHGMSHEKLQK